MVASAKELTEYAKRLGIERDDPLQPDERQAQVNDAAAAIPQILRDICPRDPYLPRGNPNPDSINVRADTLIAALVGTGHDRRAAVWAVYRLIERGFLGVEPAIVYVPATPAAAKAQEEPLPARKPSKKRTGATDVIDPTAMIREEEVLGFQIPNPTKPGPIYAKYGTVLDSQPNVPQPAVAYTEFSYLIVWSTDELWDWWKHSPQAKLSLSAESDQSVGPFPPDGFRLGGVEKSVVRDKVWKLINHLWYARNRTASFEDLAEPVWGDLASTVDKNNLGSLRRDANHFFEENSWPFRVQLKNGYASLIGRQS
jgi:hypothetical protein